MTNQANAVQELAAQQYADIANLITFQNTIAVGDIGNRLASLRSLMSQSTRDTALLLDQHPAPGLLANTGSQRGGAALGHRHAGQCQHRYEYADTRIVDIQRFCEFEFERADDRGGQPHGKEPEKGDNGW